MIVGCRVPGKGCPLGRRPHQGSNPSAAGEALSSLFFTPSTVQHGSRSSRSQSKSELCLRCAVPVAIHRFAHLSPHSHASRRQLGGYHPAPSLALLRIIVLHAATHSVPSSGRELSISAACPITPALYLLLNLRIIFDSCPGIRTDERRCIPDAHRCCTIS